MKIRKNENPSGKKPRLKSNKSSKENMKIGKNENPSEKKPRLKSNKSSKENLKQLLVLKKINKHQNNLNQLRDGHQQSLISFTLTTQNLQKSNNVFTILASFHICL
jgi:hypothetical protein